MSPEEKTELFNTIKEAHILTEAVALQFDNTVLAARKAGATWAEIGSVLGTTKQAAWERFKDLEEKDVPPDVGATAAPE